MSSETNQGWINLENYKTEFEEKIFLWPYKSDSKDIVTK